MNQAGYERVVFSTLFNESDGFLKTDVEDLLRYTSADALLVVSPTSGRSVACPIAEASNRVLFPTADDRGLLHRKRPQIVELTTAPDAAFPSLRKAIANRPPEAGAARYRERSGIWIGLPFFGRSNFRVAIDVV